MSPQQVAPPPQVQSLASLDAGQGAIITGFLGGRKLQDRLLSLGLFPGQRLTICQNNGSSLVISFNGTRLALGRGVSHKILATPTSRHCPQHDTCPCQDQDTKTVNTGSIK